MKRSGAGASDQSVSLKWISVSQHRNKTELSVNPDVNKLVFRPIGRNNCNLISVFGAARQGKSFLMNCLAGEAELFKISNQRESCTQGIDISQRLLPLSAFSAIHGGRAVNSNTRIGFVDAEGQGDRDVTYDANLICPVLLASKAVIFNWKDSMQKDKILNQLGILHKAAINVACEDESMDDDSEQKLFGHLHLVFRDWQYEGSDEKSVYNDIFKEERSAESAAAVRNQIRRSVKENFESITVWLFPAPVKDSAQLSTRLTYDITQPSFKQQLGALRAKLSTQLASPSVFDGQALCGNTIGGIVETIAGVLNTGDAVRPKPAWVSMLCSEIEQTRVFFEKALRAETEKLLVSFEKKCHCSMTTASTASRRLSADDVIRGNAGRISVGRKSLNVSASSGSSQTLISSSFPTWAQAESELRQTLHRLYSDYRSDVEAIAGVTGSGGAPSTLSAEDFASIEAAVSRSIEAEKSHFSAGFGRHCSTWVRAAKTLSLEILNSECKELQVHTPYVDSELNTAMEDFFSELTQILQSRLSSVSEYISGCEKPKAAAKSKGGSESMSNLLVDFKLNGAQAEKIEIDDTLRNLREAADLQFQVVRHVNEGSKRKAESDCHDCLRHAQRKLNSAVDEMIRNLASYSAGIPKSELTAGLDGHFKVIYDELWGSVTALPMGHQFVESLAEELAQAGKDLLPKIDSAYSAALHKYATFVVNEAKKSIVSNTEHLMQSDEPVSEQHLIAVYQEVIDKVGDVAVQSLSRWTFTNTEREDWFEGPLRLAAEERLHSLQFVNKKMLDAAAKAASLIAKQAQKHEEQQQSSKKRKMEQEAAFVMEEIAAPQPPAKARRGTKKFSSEDEEAQYDMDVEPVYATSAKPKSRRATKKFVDEDDDAQYDMDVVPNDQGEESKQASGKSTGRLPSSGASKDEQKRKAKEWALQQKQAKSGAKKAPTRPPTPPLPESEESSEDEQEAVIAVKGKGKKTAKAAPQKLSKEELISQAKEKARLAIEERKNGRLAKLAVEIEQEEALAASVGRQSSGGKRKSRGGDGN